MQVLFLSVWIVKSDNKKKTLKPPDCQFNNQSVDLHTYVVVYADKGLFFCLSPFHYSFSCTLCAEHCGAYWHEPATRDDRCQSNVPIKMGWRWWIHYQEEEVFDRAEAGSAAKSGLMLTFLISLSHKHFIHLLQWMQCGTVRKINTSVVCMRPRHNWAICLCVCSETKHSATVCIFIIAAAKCGISATNYRNGHSYSQ